MKNSHFLFIFLTALLLFVFVVVLTPTPTNWSFSYSRYDKNPHGSFMLYEELDQIFPDASIKTTDSTLFSVVSEWEEDSTAFIIITDSYYMDYQFDERIDSFVYEGNHIFISANYLDFERNDSTQIGYHNIWTNYIYDPYDYEIIFDNNRDELQDVELISSDDTISYNVRNEYISNSIMTDSTKHYQLGYTKDTLSNFIRVPYGKGNYFFYSHPGVFTNNAMLHDSLADYSTAILSHIPDVKHVVWDEYSKPGVSFFREMGKDRLSPMKFIKRNFKLAYWITLIGSLLLIFSKGKREQQAIPVVKPPKNKSVEFTKTMGRFYYEKGQHQDIAKKRMSYFELDFRRKYKIQNLNDYKGRQKELSQITGISEETIKVFYQRRELLKKAEEITELQLTQVSKSIENMKL